MTHIQEAARLQELQRYQILDTEAEAAFEQIVILTQRLFDVPIVLITLVADTRQWFKARCGLNLQETSRELSFCAHAIGQTEVMVVPDALEDARFRDNPLVTGHPGIRSYVGAPLTTPTGHHIGTLCIIDTVPRPKFTREAKTNLKDLAALVMDKLEQRRKAAEDLRTQPQQLQRSPAAHLRLLAEQLPTILWTTDCTLRFTTLNGLGLSNLGYRASQVPGVTLYEWLGTSSASSAEIIAAHLSALNGQATSYDAHVADRTFQARIEPLKNKNGDVTGCLGVALDVTEQKRAEGALDRLNEAVTHVLESVSDAVWSAEICLGGEFTYRYYSPVVEQITGWPPEFFVAHPENWLNLVHQDDRTELNYAVAQDVPVKAHNEFEYRIVRSDGEVRWVRDSVRTVVQTDGTRRLYGVISDVTERKAAERREARQAVFRRELIAIVETSLQRGLDTSFYGRLLECATRVIPGAQRGSFILQDEQGRCTYVAAVGYNLELLKRSYVWERELSRDPERPGPQLIFEFRENDAMEPERRALLYNAGPAAEIQVALSIPVEIEGKTVAYFNLDNFSSPQAFDPEAVEMAWVFAQQTAVLLKRFELERALEHFAHHDPLTSLPNRRLFEQRLAHAVEQRQADKKLIAVMMLDLENFKLINDSHGYTFGDGVLQVIAKRLSATLRDDVTLARWGSDEFVLLLPEVTDVSDVVLIAERLLTVSKDPVTVEDKVAHVELRLGIELFPGGAVQPEDLVRHADVALQYAKVSKCSYALFDATMDQAVQARLTLEADLREALGADSLNVYYQPRVSLTDGRITSFEALARWQHPVQGWVAPALFIPLAEEAGMIRQLGSQILDKACVQAKAWFEKGMATRIAVNVSGEQLRYADFVAEVQRTLERHQLDASLLELEITESVAMANVETGIDQLRGLRDLGIHLSIDDFGTAYSSLAYLKQLPVRSLKIDQVFVKELVGAPRPSEASIIQAITALARSFKLTVVAEGVETKAQRLALLALGCDEAQGYLFAKPLPEGEASELLNRRLPLFVSD